MDKEKSMKHFRKWCEEKNPLLAPISLTIAGFAKECFELAESVRKGKRIEGDIPLPTLKIWFKLYNNPKRIGRAILNTMTAVGDDIAKEANLLKILNQGANELKKYPHKFQNELKRLTQEEFMVTKQNGLKMLEEFKELIINDFVRQFNEKEVKRFKKSMPTPEAIFLIRVMVPCLVIYGTYPRVLLRQAQNGNDDALEKIIRLDKSVIFEPKISEIIHQAFSLKKQERMSIIKKAFRSSPKVNLKMKAIKCHLGGLISYFSIVLKQKITAADIRRLYDAIAQDTNGNSVDPDLYTMTEETFSKDIQDARKMWKAILPEEK